MPAPFLSTPATPLRTAALFFVAAAEPLDSFRPLVMPQSDTQSNPTKTKLGLHPITPPDSRRSKTTQGSDSTMTTCSSRSRRGSKLERQPGRWACPGPTADPRQPSLTRTGRHRQSEPGAENARAAASESLCQHTVEVQLRAPNLLEQARRTQASRRPPPHPLVGTESGAFEDSGRFIDGWGTDPTAGVQRRVLQRNCTTEAPVGNGDRRASLTNFDFTATSADLHAA